MMICRASKGKQLIIPSFVIFLSLTFSINSFAKINPHTLQERAIKRIEKYIDNFRKTGDTSKIRELQMAEKELIMSVTEFSEAGEQNLAILSLLKLGDVFRLQALWERAMLCYREALEMAMLAGHIEYKLQALTAMSQIYAYGLHDHLKARDTIREAIGLMSKKTLDESIFFDALLMSSQIEMAEGNLHSAVKSITHAIKIAKNIRDKTSLIYAHIGRANIFFLQTRDCFNKTPSEICELYSDLAQEDYDRALSISEELGYRALANSIRYFLKEAELQKHLNHKKRK